MRKSNAKTQRRKGLCVLAPLRLCVLILLGVGSVEAKETHLVIVAGIGGDEDHRERFHKWAMSMRDAATSRHGLDPKRVYYLGESPELAPDAMRAKSTRENVEALFKELSTSVAPGDQIYVLLIGHGSYDNEQARFNLPGRDLTATEWDALLAPFDKQQIVFVNTASASGGFLPALAKPNRIVVTATKSGFERNESQFAGYFVEAYTGDEADTDKNGRVSVGEAFEHARLQVASFYEEERLLKTEHAQLDDDGDGKAAAETGTRAAKGDGARAGTAFLLGAGADGISAETLASDPELARLLSERQELEGRVEALKLQKEALPEDTYMKELEELLLKLASVTERIEERSKS